MTPLTSWKEIAHYVGRGVRTVQRWEREMALPVRRPHDCHRGVVSALRADIDAWTRSQCSKSHESLQQRCARVLDESRCACHEAAQLREVSLDLRIMRRALLDNVQQEQAKLLHRLVILQPDCDAQKCKGWAVPTCSGRSV